jgi:hypothetical protein
MEKKDSKDLSAINYRYQGLANKNLEAQQIVLVKRQKIGVRSTKGLRLDLCVNILIDLGGYMQVCKDTRNISRDYRILQGASCKRGGGLLLPHHRGG